VASLNEVKAMAELVLNNFASAIIHSAVFPQYPVASSKSALHHFSINLHGTEVPREAEL